MSVSLIVAGLTELEAHLLDMLANCNRAKEPQPPPECDRSNIPDGYWMDSSCKLRPIQRIWGHIQLDALASNEPRVQVDPGGGLASDKQRNLGPKKKPKNVHPLVWKLNLALWDCQEKRARANGAFFRCVLKDGGSEESCRSLYVQVSCPDVEELYKQVSEMLAAKEGSSSSSPGFSGQGGQFGGGGASGGF